MPDLRAARRSQPDDGCHPHGEGCRVGGLALPREDILDRLGDDRVGQDLHHRSENAVYLSVGSASRPIGLQRVGESSTTKISPIPSPLRSISAVVPHMTRSAMSRK